MSAQNENFQKGEYVSMYWEQNDETLVLLTLAGEQRAYEILVRRYQNAVVSAALSVTRNQFLAEDAAQDAFVTAWMKLNTLQSPEKYCAWVCRIAKNCALNMIKRFQEYLPIETLQNLNLSAENDDPATLYVLSEEKEQIHESIGRLPEKVQAIIQLHYFEGLSIVEIADRMRISEGTVKWHLHDGRRRIRKELCAMNEKINDTLVQRVMKKVEELKLWKMKNNKDGFEQVYKNVLREVEELPESNDKYHALADVLTRGWWWLPGEKNDALFARIKEAAERGKNEEVMSFIAEREISMLWSNSGATIDFILNKQIPELEKKGFVKTLAKIYFRLGYAYFRNKMTEKSMEAYQKAKSLTSVEDTCYWIANSRIEIEKKLEGEFASKDQNKYHLSNCIDEYRFIDGEICWWNRFALSEGDLYSTASNYAGVFESAPNCDSRLFADLPLGKSFVGSDGTTLTYLSDSETVETPCGRFENCKLWVTHSAKETHGIDFYRSYYKDGVGIVKYEKNNSGYMENLTLCDYEIKGGHGLLPLCQGNVWKYRAENSSSSFKSEHTCRVVYADEGRAIISNDHEAERFSYDEDSWIDMIDFIRNEYWHCDEDGNHKLVDISHQLERATALAKTPLEKAHTKAACSVAKRIYETRIDDPDRAATGKWNFFSKSLVRRTNGNTISISHNFRWSFEWKLMHGGNDPSRPLIYNDVYGILQDAANCIWSDSWRIGEAPTIEYMLWGSSPVKTQIICEDAGTITTKAGSFDNCMKITLDISGLHCGGNKEYFFAKGIGIVKTVNYYYDGIKKAIYELTDYEGVGDGFMPIGDGFMRRYDAIDLTDGHVASVIYTYAEGENGEMLIFADRTGIQEKLSPITKYSSIQAEEAERDLWRKVWDKDYQEDFRILHAVNNFKLLLHFMFRPAGMRGHGVAPKAAEWHMYLIKIIDELLGENGDIPRAWWGVYAGLHFMTACTLFGCKKEPERELGYQYLEKCLALYPRWLEIPDGEALEVGRKVIYGDIRFIKGKNLLELPDGTREPLDYSALDDFCTISRMYGGMTALSGWEWFNTVRDSERFKEYIERVRGIMENDKNSR